MNWAYVAGYFDGEGNVSNYMTARGDRTRRISWYNSHRASLEAMKEFMGCGIIAKPREAKGGPVYALYVNRRADIIRVIDAMMPHLLVKRDAAIRLREYLDTVKDESPNRGKMAATSTEQLCKWYFEDGLSQAAIAERVGVTVAAVSQAFRVRGLKGRKGQFSKGHVRSEESRKGQAATLRKRWADPEFRARRMESIRKNKNEAEV